MISFVDNEFAVRFFSYQRNFKQVSTNPFKLNCSCPVCGDSASDQYKARFWYYNWKGSNLVHCFNCDYTSEIGRFISEQDPVLYRDYLMEKRKEESFGVDLTKKTHKPVEISEKLTSKLVVIPSLPYCVRLDKLPETHPIIKYVADRKIPKSSYNRLYFTDKWQELVNETKMTYDNPKKEYRLVIPFYNAKNEIEAYQGRALSPNARQKYMTIKAHDDASKIYGLDRVDGSKDVCVFEGPIDSMFIPNSIAIAGGSLNLDSVPFPETRIWVLDDEPRHEDTIKRMQKLIDANERVLFWDKAKWRSKDINDKVKKDGATVEDLVNYINDNWCVGLMAKARMLNYCKI